MNNMKKPSKKQVNFAEKIAHELSIKLPTEQTSYAYWKFIHDNEEAYKESKWLGTQYELDLLGIDESDYLGYIPGDR